MSLSKEEMLLEYSDEVIVIREVNQYGKRYDLAESKVPLTEGMTVEYNTS